MSRGSVKISSGVGKEGPLSSLQQAPQPSTHRHNGSFLRLPKPTLLGLCFPLAFMFARATEHTVLQVGSAIAWGISGFLMEKRVQEGLPMNNSSLTRKNACRCFYFYIYFLSFLFYFFIFCKWVNNLYNRLMRPKWPKIVFGWNIW